MTRPKLHLDAGASRRALCDGLTARGHDVTRTPQPDLPADASDDLQLLWATAQGRILFTHNVRDFIQMTRRYPRHSGIALAHRESYSLAQLINFLDRMLSETQAEEWVGQVRWLSDWKE